MRDQFFCGRGKKKRNLTVVSFYRQLDTSWPNKFRQFVWVVVWGILFYRSHNFYWPISAITFIDQYNVGGRFTDNNASLTQEDNRFIFYDFIKANLSTKRNYGGWRGAGANKNFIFRPPPCTSLCRRCTTHCVIAIKTNGVIQYFVDYQWTELFNN